MKKHNQHTNERSNMHSIYYSHEKSVYSMPFAKKKKKTKNKKIPHQKHFQLFKSQNCKCKMKLQKHTLLITSATRDFN